MEVGYRAMNTSGLKVGDKCGGVHFLLGNEDFWLNWAERYRVYREVSLRRRSDSVNVWI